MNERQDGDISVKDVHAKNPVRDRNEKFRTAFRELEEEIEERDKEAADDQEGVENIPGFDVPSHEPFRFFRDIRVPDQHVLRKTYVAPENGENEQELAHNVVVLFVHEPKVAGISQRVYDDDD